MDGPKPVLMESERALTLSETILTGRVFGERSSSAKRLAFACTVALAGWTGAQGMMLAQVVKAPRYSGANTVDAPSPSLNLPPLPPAISPHGVVVEDVVARINDQIISRSDVERSAEQLQQEIAQNKLSAGDAMIAQRDMLRDMIDEQLLLSKAKELGLNVDADVVRKLDEIRKQNKMESLDDLEKAAKDQGYNYEDFKAQIRNGILKQRVVSEEVGRKIQLSESEENKYYTEHQKEFEQPEQEKLSEILVPLPENASADAVAQAEKKANEIKTKVMQGGDFAALAKQYSGGSTAAQGGDLGVYKKGGGTLPQVFEDQTFNLKAGESTQPVRTRQGFVILKVTDHTNAGPAPLKDVEPQIQEAIYMNAMQPALRKYLTQLREDSYVELAPGFVDSGASPNELKPLYTSYTAPPVKKKKVKVKSRFDARTGGGRTQTASAKAPVVSSPDNGGRTYTGKDSAPPGGVAPAAAVDANTGLAVITPTKSGRMSQDVASNKKPKREKREKIRFGQAPRNSIPAGSADETPTAEVAGTTAAPGAVMASGGTGIGTAAVADGSAPAAGVDENPLNATEAPKKKTRYAATATAVKAKKVATVSNKEREKKLGTAAPASAEENADTKQQAAPLGLSGDTVKKPKKVKTKKVKGQPKAPKERLQEKAPVAPAVVAPVDQTASPKLAPTDVPATPANSSVPKAVPNQSDTTLPPVTQPPPGSPQQGQPVPGTNPPN